MNRSSYADPGHYHLEIKRAETDIRLDWSDRAEIWPGVINLVTALEEIYSQLSEKYSTTASDNWDLTHNAALQPVELR